MANERKLKFSSIDPVDFEKMAIRSTVKVMEHIRKNLAEETGNELRGCENPVTIQDLLEQHESEQAILRQAIGIISDYSGVSING